MNRRDFLRTFGVGGATVAASGCVVLGPAPRLALCDEHDVAPDWPEWLTWNYEGTSQVIRLQSASSANGAHGAVYEIHPQREPGGHWDDCFMWIDWNEVGPGKQFEGYRAMVWSDVPRYLRYEKINGRKHWFAMRRPPRRVWAGLRKSFAI